MQSGCRNALLTTWKELFLLILNKSEFFGQKIDSLTIGVFFPIGTEFQKGEHDALKIRYGHFLFPYIVRATQLTLQTAGWVALLTQRNFLNSSAVISQSRMI
jgi:hypothetical protein